MLLSNPMCCVTGWWAKAWSRLRGPSSCRECPDGGMCRIRVWHGGTYSQSAQRISRACITREEACLLPWGSG